MTFPWVKIPSNWTEGVDLTESFLPSWHPWSSELPLPFRIFKGSQEAAMHPMSENASLFPSHQQDKRRGFQMKIAQIQCCPILLNLVLPKL
jgi:hypothetical protein